jgi:predicted metal-dependent HD superfamily phosphohydrolase
MSDPDWLASRWQELWAPYPIGSVALESTFADLVRRYDDPARAYHNLHHLRHVLTTIDALAHLTSDVQAVRLAAWFHDVIYDPRASENEERSAAFAAAELRGFRLPEHTIQRVGELILLTKTHAFPPGDADAAVLLDSDLAILGAPPAEYAAYAAGIRQEYAYVSDADYRAAVGPCSSVSSNGRASSRPSRCTRRSMRRRAGTFATKSPGSREARPTHYNQRHATLA